MCQRRPFSTSAFATEGEVSVAGVAGLAGLEAV